MPIIAEDSQLIVVVCRVTSVADPFHFDTDPDPTKNQKKIVSFFYNFFSSDYSKNYLLL